MKSMTMIKAGGEGSVGGGTDEGPRPEYETEYILSRGNKAREMRLGSMKNSSILGSLSNEGELEVREKKLAEARHCEKEVSLYAQMEFFGGSRPNEWDAQPKHQV